MDFSSQLAHSQDVATKVASLLQKRMKIAQEHYTQRVEQAYKAHAAAAAAAVQTADPWTSMYRYGVDFAQRSILFWDTLRQRGNNFVEHARRGHAAGAALRLRDDARRAHVRAPGQLRARAHHAAGRRDGRCEAAALRHHRSARGPRPRHRRLQGRFAGRRRAARRPSGLFRHLLPRSRAGPDAARRVRRRAAVRAQGARACTRTARSPRSSATARAAGRR